MSQTIIPISRNYPEEGNIHLHSFTPYPVIHNTAEGVFSFTFYYNESEDKIQKSLYYRGIEAYLSIIRNNDEYYHDFSNELSKPTFSFKNWYVVIYTNEPTRSILERAYGEYLDKIIFAVVNYPRYTNSEGNCEETILRTMRLQCFETFPNQYCMIRDADTLFPDYIQQIIQNISYTDTKTRIIKLIYQWELIYFHRWVTIIKKPIVLGSQQSYLKEWHFNFPKPLPVSKMNYMIDPDMLFSYESRENPEGFIISPPQGIFAGFVNFSKNKQQINELWKHCIDYLHQRYFMFHHINTGQRLISDSFTFSTIIDKYAITRKYASIKIGKDERVLIFAVIRFYLEHIYFLNINYGNKFLLDTGDETESYINTILTKTNVKYINKQGRRALVTYHDMFYQEFREFNERYEKYLKIEKNPENYRSILDEYYKSTSSPKNLTNLFAEPNLKEVAGGRRQGRKTAKKARKFKKTQKLDRRNSLL